MRVVLDPNVLVSALISPSGPTEKIVRAWVDEGFELIVSPALVAELEGVLARPKLRRWISESTSEEFIAALAQEAAWIADPPLLEGLTPDPDDDYLVALARAAGADFLVSGDRHLTTLVDPSPPILTPRRFLERLRGERLE